VFHQLRDDVEEGCAPEGGEVELEPRPNDGLRRGVQREGSGLVEDIDCVSTGAQSAEQLGEQCCIVQYRCVNNSYGLAKLSFDGNILYIDSDSALSVL
jgi:hypothetical protein